LRGPGINYEARIFDNYLSTFVSKEEISSGSLILANIVAKKLDSGELNMFEVRSLFHPSFLWSALSSRRTVPRPVAALFKEAMESPYSIHADVTDAGEVQRIYGPDSPYSFTPNWKALEFYGAVKRLEDENILMQNMVSLLNKKIIRFDELQSPILGAEVAADFVDRVRRKAATLRAIELCWAPLAEVSVKPNSL
jgi:hypothetical protein